MKEEDVRTLLDKYLDGTTSNAEEQALRRYFTTNGKDVPEEWKVYRALFSFEACERKQHESHAVTARPRKDTSIRQMLIWSASIAASAIFLFSVALPQMGRETRNYVLIDGQKQTDKEVVMQEAEAALTQVSSDEEESFGALRQMQ
ncbi:MAG: hypothetical protein SPI18_00925 [Prevotella sp.]|nr:hypothetical protein [Prevotella sp.]MDY6129847.1 hypothetical protein [Prevotella sp.]